MLMQTARYLDVREKLHGCAGFRLELGCIVLLIAFCLAIAPYRVHAASAPAIPLLGAPFEIEPAKGQARFMITPELDLPPEQVAERLDEFTLAQRRHLDVPSLTFPASDVWLHFRVANASDAAATWVVDFHRPVGTINATGFELAPGPPGGPIRTLFECVPGSCRGAYGSAYISGVLSLEPGEVRDILIRYRLSFSSQAPVRFVTPLRYLTNKAQRNIWAWIINGIWFGMIALAVLFHRVIGWPLAISFAGYSATAMLLVNISGATLNLSGLGLVLPFLEGAALQAGLVLFLQFGRTFFATHRKHPKADQFMRAIMVLSGLNLVLLIAGYDVAARAALQLLAAAALAVQFTVAVRALKAGWSGALPILIGTVIIALAFLTDTSNKLFNGLIHRDTVVVAGHLAFFFEAVCFAVAISMAVIRIDRERDAAVEKQLAAAQEQLKLLGELQNSQRRFEDARREAERRRQEIEALGHDLMQPLRTLRSAFRRRQQGRERQLGDAEAAFALLESIAARQFDTSDDEAPHTPEALPIAVILDNTHRMFADEARAAGIELRTVFSSRVVNCDPIALMRVVSNLVSNAINHSRAQRIVIGCRLQANMLRLEVHDDGIGMKPDELERYLEKGVRSPQSSGRGLGLAIAGSLCAKDGLHFSWRSRAGAGSVFSVELPLAGDRPEPMPG